MSERAEMQCNRGLGLFYDNTTALTKAIDYLNKGK